MKKDNWIVRNLVAATATGIVILILTIFFLKIVTRHNQELEVPDFSGMTITEAVKVAKDKNLRLEVTDSVFLPRVGRGIIFRQNPVSGSMVKKNRRVLLTINSIQPKRVSMPSIIGYSLRQAKAELTAKQLNVGKLIYVNDMATNNVLSQRFEGRFIPTGTMIETESEIDLELGMSPDNSMTSIPSLVGFSLVTAKDIIIDNSLNIGKLTFDQTVKNYADTFPGFLTGHFRGPTEPLPFFWGSRVDLVLSTDKTKIDTKNKSL